MWCAHCQADVAAELSADNRRLRCTVCSLELKTPVPTAASAAVPSRDAKSLLKRWSTETLPELFDTLPLTPVSRPISGSRDEPLAERGPAEHAPTGNARRRVDAAHPDGALRPNPPARSARSKPRVDSSAARPHVQPPAEPPAVSTSSPPRSGWIGQACAYLGVLGFTVGAMLIVYGYFGGPSNHLPTGWLVMSIGQMLLLLGIITLVSGGMDQTTETVSRQVARISSQVARLEESHRELLMHGPHWAPPDDEDAETAHTAERELVGS